MTIKEVPIKILLEGEPMDFDSKEYRECLMSLMNKIIEHKSCFQCKFYDGVCCMYDCQCRVIRDEEESAISCTRYVCGEYDEMLLEQANYR